MDLLIIKGAIVLYAPLAGKLETTCSWSGRPNRRGLARCRPRHQAGWCSGCASDQGGGRELEHAQPPPTTCGGGGFCCRSRRRRPPAPHRADRRTIDSRDTRSSSSGRGQGPRSRIGELPLRHGSRVERWSEAPRQPFHNLRSPLVGAHPWHAPEPGGSDCTRTDPQAGAVFRETSSIDAAPMLLLDNRVLWRGGARGTLTGA